VLIVPAEALLWVRLSCLFSVEELIWRYAEIVGLGVSQNGCRQQAEALERFPLKRLA
jgi:hypothetical protein